MIGLIVTERRSEPPAAICIVRAGRHAVALLNEFHVRKSAYYFGLPIFESHLVPLARFDSMGGM
jgi:hypothetical protein